MTSRGPDYGGDDVRVVRRTVDPVGQPEVVRVSLSQKFEQCLTQFLENYHYKRTLSSEIESLRSLIYPWPRLSLID
jgi:hypothetical protein